jgi:hypothetical protein
MLRKQMAPHPLLRTGPLDKGTPGGADATLRCLRCRRLDGVGTEVPYRGRVVSRYAIGLSKVRPVHRLLHDCLLSGDGSTLSFLNSRLDVRIKLGRLTTIGHSIVSDDPNTAMAQFALR